MSMGGGAVSARSVVVAASASMGGSAVSARSVAVRHLRAWAAAQ